MATRIRLARGGRRNRPFYRIVVADSRAPRDGKFIERIGSYDPLLTENKATVDVERARHWLDVGAKPSERVSKLLALQGVEHKLVIVRQYPAVKPDATEPAAAEKAGKGAKGKQAVPAKTVADADTPAPAAVEEPPTMEDAADTAAPAAVTEPPRVEDAADTAAPAAVEEPPADAGQEAPAAPVKTSARTAKADKPAQESKGRKTSKTTKTAKPSKAAKSVEEVEDASGKAGA